MIMLIFPSLAPSLIKVHLCRPHKRRGKVKMNTQLYLSVQDAALLSSFCRRTQFVSRDPPLN